MLIEEVEAAVSYDVFRSVCGSQVILVIYYCVTNSKLNNLKANKYLLSLRLSVIQDFREGSVGISLSHSILPQMECLLAEPGIL